ncbi:hypothetical protein [Kribbella sp. NPDC055071]
MDAKATVERVLTDARRDLNGTTQAGATIDTITWYGAVDIDPKYLVIWVLLTGLPDDQLPEWYFPESDPAPTNLPAALLTACTTWRTALHQRFTTASWPAAPASASKAPTE